MSTQSTIDLMNQDGTRAIAPRPMVDMGWLRTEMCKGKGEEFVNEEVTARRLRWAFDFRRKDSEFQFLMVWRKGFLHWRDPKNNALPTSWRDLYHDLFPAQSFLTGVLLATELEDALNFGSDHVYDLIEDGAIKTEGTWQRGRGGSAKIKRISVEAFLQDRRMI